MLEGARRPWPWALLVILALVLLRAPTLNVGFALDDYTHQAVLEGVLQHPTLTPSQLYDFGEFDQLAGALADQSGAPFWIDEGLRVRFFRPLTSLSLRVDHALFGSWALGYHLVNLALWTVLLILLLRLYRSLGLSMPLALLALGIYGSEDGAHSVVVGWIANRNSLLEAVFGVAALVLAVGGTGPRSLARLGTSFVLAAAATACKESGMVFFWVLAILAAWAPLPVWRETSFTARRSYASLCAVVGLGYPLVLLAAGYGSNSSFYPVPWHAPVEFFQGLGLHLTVGLATTLGPFSTDVAFLAPGAKLVLVPLSIVVLIAAGRPIYQRAKQLSGAGLLALWAGLAWLPQWLAAPSDRLIFVPMMGIAPLVAATLQGWWQAGIRGREARTQRLAAIVLGFLVLPLSAFASFAQQSGFLRMAEVAREAIASPELVPPGAESGAESSAVDVFVLQTPMAVMALNLSAMRWGVVGDQSLRFWPLQAGRRPLLWTRTGEASFTLASESVPFLISPVESIFRRSRSVPETGRVYRVGPVEVEVLEGAQSLEVRLERSLDDPGLRFVAWDGEGWVHLPPPAVGETSEVPEADPPLPLLP